MTVTTCTFKDVCTKGALCFYYFYGKNAVFSIKCCRNVYFPTLTTMMT
jgi:hypothetical protein